MDVGLTEIDMAQFTGKDPSEYGRYLYEALEQAGDLLELATGLTSVPSEGLVARIARRGILAMAEAIYEGNAFRDYRHSPFRSETIGSYTYSLAEGNVLAGIPTGISWFDVAVDRLTESSVPTISSSSISAFDRKGDIETSGGRPILVGPADTERFRQGPPTVDDSAERPRG